MGKQEGSPAEQRAKLRRDRRATGLCVRCGRPSDGGSAMCSICRQRANLYRQNLRDRRKDGKCCISCGKQDRRTREGKTMCAKCAAKQCEATKRYYHRMKSDRVCTGCRKPLPEGYDKTRCEECLRLNRSEWHLNYESRKLVAAAGW